MTVSLTASACHVVLSVAVRFRRYLTEVAVVQGIAHCVSVTSPEVEVGIVMGNDCVDVGQVCTEIANPVLLVALRLEKADYILHCLVLGPMACAATLVSALS
jgi:hypothetical protein